MMKSMAQTFMEVTMACAKVLCTMMLLEEINIIAWKERRTLGIIASQKGKMNMIKNYGMYLLYSHTQQPSDNQYQNSSTWVNHNIKPRYVLTS
jgi:hypothetical protein